jgi:ComB9 competence protein
MKWLLCIVLAVCLAYPAQAEIIDESVQKDPNKSIINTPVRNNLPLHQIQRAFDNSKNDANTEELPYNRMLTYKVLLREYMTTLIVLPEGENIKTITVGDKVNFAATPIYLEEGEPVNKFEVFGKYPGADTNVRALGESGNIYNFYLRIDSVNSENLPHLTFFITDPLLTQKMSLAKRQKESSIQKNKFKPKAQDNLEGLADYLHKLKNVEAGDLNFNYQVTDPNIEFAPIRIFDNGHMTFFQFAEKNFDQTSNLPVILMVKGKSDTYVNSTPIPGTGIIRVETVSPTGRFTIVNGDQYVCVRRAK